MAMGAAPGAAIHCGITVVPAAAMIAAGIRIARSLVLAVGVRIELRAVTRIVDHFLRLRRHSQRGSLDRGRNQVFHRGLLGLVLRGEQGDAIYVPAPPSSRGTPGPITTERRDTKSVGRLRTQPAKA